MPISRPRRAPGTRGGCFAVLDPATGEAFDEAPGQRPDEPDAIVGRARAAWRGRRADPAARTTALLAAADAVEAAGAGLAPLLTRAQGKPLAESYAEVARTAAMRNGVDQQPRRDLPRPALRGHQGQRCRRGGRAVGAVKAVRQPQPVRRTPTG